jgi:alpha-L-fucosidase
MKMLDFRKILVAMFFSMAFLPLLAQQDSLPIAGGKFTPTDVSLKQYQYPEWFRDAKFGIWAHWGPQAVPRRGDWYARNLYIQDAKDWQKGYYEDHLKRYGHPSEKGYKDIIPLWKAEKWHPEALMKLYKKTGAKYFVSMGTHHDNFFLWNSKLHKWNAMNMGPKKDVVGLWQAAAKKEGLRFGISEHLAASYTWFQTAHSADKTGDKAGVPYDGNDPRYEDLYHGKAAADDNGWMTKNPVWQREWFDRIKEVVDLYQPDFLYSDSKIPFENVVGRSLIAHFYNQDMAKNGGHLAAVYTCKEASDNRFVQDVEKGVLDSICPFPWQTDTSIGDWFYRTGQKYKTAPEVIQLLVDIVSKNGNLLLNVVQTPEGDLEPNVIAILDGIGQWIKDNGEGIYGTRPWKVYGEGPSTTQPQEKGAFGGLKDVRKYTASDIRYTIKQGVVYAFCMENPTQNIRLVSLGKHSKLSTKKVTAVTRLGSSEKLNWKQENEALVIKKPLKSADYSVMTFKISFGK